MNYVQRGQIDNASGNGVDAWGNKPWHENVSMEIHDVLWHTWTHLINIFSIASNFALLSPKFLQNRSFTILIMEGYDFERLNQNFSIELKLRAKTLSEMVPWTAWTMSTILRNIAHS